MNHENNVHHQEHSNAWLAFSATLHCLVGCGIGEVLGVIIGLALGFSGFSSILIGVILGFLLGFMLGILPLLRAKKGFLEAFHIIFISEFISITIMETTEVLIEVFTPGVMNAGIASPVFWGGMFLALTGSFIVTYPVNYLLIKRGVRHTH